MARWRLTVAAETNNSSPIRRLERHFDGDAVGGLWPQAAAPRGLERGQIIRASTRSAKYKDTLGGVGYIDANLARTLLLNGEV